MTVESPADSRTKSVCFQCFPKLKASNVFRLTVITSTARQTRFPFLSLWVRMTETHPSPSVSTYFITPIPSLPLHAFRVSLICFIPSNLAFAVSWIPLLAVCVWKIESRVYVCLVLSFIPSDESHGFKKSFVWCVLCTAVCLTGCCGFSLVQLMVLEVLLLMWVWLFF